MNAGLKIVTRCVIGVVAALAAGCSWVAPIATSEATTLEYVGAVKFGQPIREASCVVIPLSYEGGQWARNSAIVPFKVTSEVKGSEVEMTVITAVGDAEHGYRLVLPAGSKGQYTVFYRDPDGTRHKLDVITVGE